MMGAHASLSHFFKKLVFAAPASGFPFLSIAFGSQLSFAHLVMKLFSAAPANGLPFLSIALLWQVPWAIAGLSANVVSRTAMLIRFTSNLRQLCVCAGQLPWIIRHATGASRGLNTSWSLVTVTASGCHGFGSPASHHSPRSQ